MSNSTSFIMPFGNVVDDSASEYEITQVSFCCFTQDKKSAAAAAFLEVAGDIDDTVFGITGEDSVFSEYKISGDAVVLFKNVSISGLVRQRCFLIGLVVCQINK
jgi:hypothetical protein